MLYLITPLQHRPLVSDNVSLKNWHLSVLSNWKTAPTSTSRSTQQKKVLVFLLRNARFKRKMQKTTQISVQEQQRYYQGWVILRCASWLFWLLHLIYSYLLTYWHQRLISSRSLLAHAYCDWSPSVASFVRYPAHRQNGRQNERSHNSASLGWVTNLQYMPLEWYIHFRG